MNIGFNALLQQLIEGVKDLARPFSIIVGSIAVAYATMHTINGEIVALCSAMVGGNAFFHGKDKVSIAKINGERDVEEDKTEKHDDHTETEKH